MGLVEDGLLHFSPPLPPHPAAVLEPTGPAPVYVFLVRRLPAPSSLPSRSPQSRSEPTGAPKSVAFPRGCRPFDGRAAPYRPERGP